MLAPSHNRKWLGNGYLWDTDIGAARFFGGNRMLGRWQRGNGMLETTAITTGLQLATL